VEVKGWWEWPPATITREIAVKNRSHNQKTRLNGFPAAIIAVPVNSRVGINPTPTCWVNVVAGFIPANQWAEYQTNNE
jgi:hypothetical protein